MAQYLITTHSALHMEIIRFLRSPMPRMTLVIREIDYVSHSQSEMTYHS